MCIFHTFLWFRPRSRLQRQIVNSTFRWFETNPTSVRDTVIMSLYFICLYIYICAYGSVSRGPTEKYKKIKNMNIVRVCIYFIKNHKRTEHLRRVVKIDRYSGGFLVTFFSASLEHKLCKKFVLYVNTSACDRFDGPKTPVGLGRS